jgi:hypothetical protein
MRKLVVSQESLLFLPVTFRSSDVVLEIRRLVRLARSGYIDSSASLLGTIAWIIGPY